MILSPTRSLLQRKVIRHFMDIKASSEVSPELARELLIAISYSLPDKALSADSVPETCDSEHGMPVINGDGAEKFRSELISISHSQSPDISLSPATCRKP